MARVRVMLTTPALVAARLLENVDAYSAEWLSQIRMLDSWTVNMSWPHWAFESRVKDQSFVVSGLRGYATLAWRLKREARDELVVRAFLGGDAMKGCSSLSDAVELAKKEMSMWFDVKSAALNVGARYRAQVLPQYAQGHARRLALSEARLRALGRIALAGNVCRGLSVEDCIQSGQHAARTVMQA